jgi:hypothetical protein
MAFLWLWCKARICTDRAFVLIMVFALVYWLGDGIRRLKENDGDNNRVPRWAAFYNAFYFSVVTFTTVGYGDWYPEDRYRIVVMIEGVLGWLLLALFIHDFRLFGFYYQPKLDHQFTR